MHQPTLANFSQWPCLKISHYSILKNRRNSGGLPITFFPTSVWNSTEYYKFPVHAPFSDTSQLLIVYEWYSIPSYGHSRWISHDPNGSRQLVPVKEETLEFYEETVRMPAPPPATSSPWDSANAINNYHLGIHDRTRGNGDFGVGSLNHVILLLNQGLLEGFVRKIASSHFEAA